MTEQPDQGSGGSHWAVLGPEVPSDLAGRRVLDVGAAHDDSSAALRERGAQEIVEWDPVRNLGPEPGEAFDLVYCRDTLQRDPHPMNLLSRLWHLSAEGALLLLESRVMLAAELSRYARFVSPAGASDPPSEWLPGRLALRWTVETSGFDVDHWLTDVSGAANDDEASAYLQATRSARMPALDLAIPAETQ